MQAAIQRQSSASPNGNLAALQFIHPVCRVQSQAAKAALPSYICFDGKQKFPLHFCYRAVCNVMLRSSCTLGTCATTVATKKVLLHLFYPLQAWTGHFASCHLGVPLSDSMATTHSIFSKKCCDARCCIHYYLQESRRTQWRRKGNSTGHPWLAKDTLKQAGIRE